MAGARFAGVTQRAKDAFGKRQISPAAATPESKRELETNKFGWSLLQPSSAVDSNGNEVTRNISTKATKQRNKKKSKKFRDMEDDDIDDGGSNACNRLYENIHSWIIDQWRRTTQSDCDPYVVVELRPDGERHATDSVIGGGKDVEWTSLDNNTTIFKNLTVQQLSQKYLNFRVYDEEIGSSDEHLGEASILLTGILEPNRQYYATINLFEAKKWSGLLTIGGKIVAKTNTTNTTNTNTNLTINTNTNNNKNNTNNTNIQLFSVDSKYDLHVTILYADNLLLAEQTTDDKPMTFLRFFVQLVVVACYILLVAGIFVVIEGWSLGDSVWFMIVTMCCVGYGDFSPETIIGQIVNSFFIITNLFFFGWAVSVTFTYLGAQQNESMKKGLSEYKKFKYKSDRFLLSVSKFLDVKVRRKLGIRRADFNKKRAQKELEQIQQSEMLRQQSHSQVRLAGLGGLGPDREDKEVSPTPPPPAGAIGGYSYSSTLGAAAGTGAINAMSGMSTGSNATIESLRESLAKEMVTGSEEIDDDDGVDDGIDIKEIETPQEKAKREKMLREQKAMFLKRTLILTWLLLAGIFALGTVFYGWLDYSEAEAQETYFEDADWPSYDAFDGFRFCIVSLTTVGYGDMYPQTPGGRLFCALFLLIGVSVLTQVIGTTFEMIGDWEKEKKKQRKMMRALLSANAMQEFDEDGSGDIDRYEFLKTMLLIRGDVEKSRIDRIMKKFNEIDTDGSGEIDFEDFKKATQKDLNKIENKLTNNPSLNLVSGVSTGPYSSKMNKYSTIDDDNKNYDNDDDDNAGFPSNPIGNNNDVSETTALLS